MLRLICLAAIAFAATTAELPQADLARSIEAQGGYVVRAADGSITDVSLARTWATDNDVERVAEIKTLKRLNLSFTYVTDRGIERLQQLPKLEELNLDTDEFITDAATNYLRANRTLRKLIFRGTDITDVGMPYISQLTRLRVLDISYTMIGDVGLESLPALAQLEELKLGGDRISGINLNFLKLLPKLTKLDLNGIQRRNAGACWSPLITDLDLETISQLSGLEELNLGIGVSLGIGGKAIGGGNCHVSGGIKISDLGVAKLARLRNLRQLDISGAKITPEGLKPLSELPALTRLSVWNCSTLDDSAAPELAALRKLAILDLSYTHVGDATLQKLSALPNLRTLYLTDTKVSQAAADAYRAQKPGRFVSWVQRPAPIPKPVKKVAKADPAEVEP